MQITSIHIYPIKSLGGISLESATVEPQGLQYDRRWMIVDPETKKFLTQRQIPEMALLRIELGDSGLQISHLHKGISPLELPFEAPASTGFEATVWNDTVSVVSMGADARKWLSEALGQATELVHMPDATGRAVKDKYTPDGSYVNLSDRSPFLLIGKGSLDELNSRLDQPVPMNRFRPNFVFEGGSPFVEDTWNTVEIGSTEFDCIGPCGRCKVITIDQDTGIKGEEPFATLSTYRRPEKSILFGQMLIRKRGNEVRVGDRVKNIR